MGVGVWLERFRIRYNGCLRCTDCSPSSSVQHVRPAATQKVKATDQTEKLEFTLTNGCKKKDLPEVIISDLSERPETLVETCAATERTCDQRQT